MKKLFTVLLAALLLVSVAACRKETGTPVENIETAPGQSVENEPEPEPGMLTGGWQVAEDNTITEERKALFEKALEGLVGVNYVPVAYLGSQVVAGTNHCFLTQATVVYPDASPMFTLVYIYEDLSGNAEILNITNMPVVPIDGGTAAEAPDGEMLMGGWAYEESPEITDEIKARLEKALEELVGATYEPIANLATQVVAGLNRCVLCKVTPILPNAVADYALVYVYEDLEGGATLQYVISFTIDMQDYLPAEDAEAIDEAEIGADDIFDGPISGGWQVALEPEMTDELSAIFTKALDGLVGVDYTPIALLGTQVVAGTNYCFLAQATVVYPGAVPTYVLVYIYEDLSGNAEIMNFADMPVVPNDDGTAAEVQDEMTAGGWYYTEAYEITPEIEDRFGKALNSYGYLAVYEPVASLAEQIVAGTNRCLLVRFTERIPDAQPEYKLMYVYEALDGTAEMLHVIDFDFGALCTYGA